VKIDPYYQRQNDSFSCVELNDVQIVHKFAGRETRNPDFKDV